MSSSEEKIIQTTCASHCGGTCVLKVHVKDGVITRMETDDGPEPQLRACVRGRAQRQRAYAPDRIIYPLKRVGERGEGNFKRISWDEALDTVAREILRVRDTYGPQSIMFMRGVGDINQLHTMRHFHKLFCRIGGYTAVWGAASYQGGLTSCQATYGSMRTSNSRDDLLNSRLIIMWGWDPACTVTGTNTSWYIAQAREKGTRIISVDPRYTPTTATFADQWIPIIPGTDAAMLIAMAYTMIKENVQNQVFLDKYTFRFDKFKAYILGDEDGIVRTPAWAEKITGVPASTIEALAREYATTRPAALIAGIGPGRTARGEMYHRAASTLAAMTGNIGIHGGDAAGKSWETATWYPYKMKYGLAPRPEEGRNPIGQPPVTDGRNPTYVPFGIHHTKLPDFIMKGKAGGFPADIKLMFIHNRSYINQFPNTNKIIQALKQLEFLVITEQFPAPTTRYADIVLPTATFLERNDIDFGVGIPFYGYVNQAIAPVGEVKSHLEIARELAKRLGIKHFGDETEDELLRQEVANTEIPDYDEFKKQGVHRLKRTEPWVAFQKQIEDPVNNPFPTPSGKIEIYSKELADLDDPECPPIAKYLTNWEDRNDPLINKYPLQLLTTHSLRRQHSQSDTLPWLREIVMQAVEINTDDAWARKIKDGDLVRVFNDRGQMVLPAKVTTRIMPGVVNVPQGAWYAPDKDGVDRGGCANVLTRDEPSPGGAFPYNTALVEVKLETAAWPERKRVSRRMRPD